MNFRKRMGPRKGKVGWKGRLQWQRRASKANDRTTSAKEGAQRNSVSGHQPGASFENTICVRTGSPARARRTLRNRQGNQSGFGFSRT